MDVPKDVKLVLGSGAGGGLVSWAFTVISGSTFGLSVWAALPLLIILGAAAALVAVYVVIPADVTKTAKLIAFAVLCGFLWKPVLDAGRIVITQRLEVSATTAEVKKNVAELKAAPPATVAAKAHEAADAASELLRTGDRLANPQIAREASVRATEAVNAIAETSAVDPAAATVALQQISAAASNSNDENVAILANRSIAIIQQDRVSSAPLPPPAAVLPPSDRP
jgi:hypothetical protein